MTLLPSYTLNESEKDGYSVDFLLSCSFHSSSTFHGKKESLLKYDGVELQILAQKQAIFMPHAGNFGAGEQRRARRLLLPLYFYLNDGC